jgi:hypothetical protein
MELNFETFFHTPTAPPPDWHLRLLPVITMPVLVGLLLVI